VRKAELRHIRKGLYWRGIKANAFAIIFGDRFPAAETY
jgi:hypothetical protein